MRDDDVRGQDSTDPPARRGIQSVGIGFRVLAALVAEPEPATLSAVAKRSGLSAAQAHKYLVSLIASGMARQERSSGRYELGAQAIALGLAALARTDTFAAADPAIEAFTRETGRTTLVAALGPYGPTIVRWHPGRVPVITSLAVGSVLPLFRSATGHAFLGFLSDNEIAAALALERTSHKGAPAVDVAAIQRNVRASMSASVDELVIPGLRASAVPILNIQRRPALVATVIATPAFDRADDDAVLARLKSACRLLTENIGGSWP